MLAISLNPTTVQLMIKTAVSEVLSLLLINLKVRYRQTFIGFFWVIINPITLYFVQAFLFTKILNPGNSQYPMYLLTGLLPWFYISQTAEMGCNYIATNSGLIKNLKLHPAKLIASLALENYINFIFSFAVIFSYSLFNYEIGDFSLVYFLIASVWLILVVSCISFISSVLNIIYKDTKYILHFLFTILYFLTPTFFYEAQLPSWLVGALKLNPFYWVIGMFRIHVLNEQGLLVLAVNIVILLALAAASAALWLKIRNSVYSKI